MLFLGSVLYFSRTQKRSIYFTITGTLIGVEIGITDVMLVTSNHDTETRFNYVINKILNTYNTTPVCSGCTKATI